MFQDDGKVEITCGDASVNQLSNCCSRQEYSDSTVHRNLYAYEQDDDILLKWRVNRRLEEARQAVRNSRYIYLPSSKSYCKSHHKDAVSLKSPGCSSSAMKKTGVSEHSSYQTEDGHKFHSKRICMTPKVITQTNRAAVSSCSHRCSSHNHSKDCPCSDQKSCVCDCKFFCHCFQCSLLCEPLSSAPVTSSHNDGGDGGNGSDRNCSKLKNLGKENLRFSQPMFAERSKHNDEQVIDKLVDEVVHDHLFGTSSF